jgi:hypothetical protein
MLISLGDSQDVTHLLRRAALDVAQRDHHPLVRWQDLDRLADLGEGFLREEAEDPGLQR